MLMTNEIMVFLSMLDNVQQNTFMRYLRFTKQCVTVFVELLYRTDFFPGLGWMLTRSTFLELQPKWPKT